MAQKITVNTMASAAVIVMGEASSWFALMTCAAIQTTVCTVTARLCVQRVRETASYQ